MPTANNHPYAFDASELPSNSILVSENATSSPLWFAGACFLPRLFRQLTTLAPDWETTLKHYLFDHAGDRQELVCLASLYDSDLYEAYRADLVSADPNSARFVDRAISVLAPVLQRIAPIAEPFNDMFDLIRPMWALAQGMPRSRFYTAREAFLRNHAQNLLSTVVHDQQVRLLGHADISRFRQCTNADGHQALLPLHGDCIVFGVGRPSENLIIAVMRTGLAVVCRELHDRGVPNTVICNVMHISQQAPIIGDLIREGIRGCIRMLRNYCDRHNGVSYFGETEAMNTPLSRRAGIDSRQWSRVFGTLAPFAETVRAHAAELPADWRASLTPGGVAPVRRSSVRRWNWNRINPEVARIMEHDLTMHLDEPNP